MSNVCPLHRCNFSHSYGSILSDCRWALNEAEVPQAFFLGFLMYKQKYIVLSPLVLQSTKETWKVNVFL